MNGEKNYISNERVCRAGIINWCLIGIFVALVGVMMLVMPRMLDDLWYSLQLRPWYEAQGIPFPTQDGDVLHTPGVWSGIRQIWLDHYYTDNIRLGNIIAPVLIVLPLWIGKSLSVFLLLYVVACSLRMAGVNMRRSPLVVLMLVLLSVILTWNEYLVALDYQINYVWSSALALWLLASLGLPHVDCPLSVRPSPVRTVWLFILGLLCGWWHEGFGVPVAGALILMSILFKNWRRSKFIAAELGLVVGTLLLALSPGMMGRVGAEVDKTMSFSTVASYGAMSCLWVTSIIILLVKERGHYGHFVRTDALSLFLAVTCLISFVIAFKVNSPTRPSWWGRLCSIILFVHVLRRYWPDYWATYRSCRIWPLLLICLTACYVRFGFGISACLEYRYLFPKYVEEYRKGPREWVFGTVYEPQMLSPVSYYLPFHRFPNEVMSRVDVYTRKSEEGLPGLGWVIPSELRYVNGNSGKEVPGGSGVRELDGYLFMPWGEDDVPLEAAMNLDYGYGLKRRVVFPYEFISEGDGERYVYISVASNWVENYFGKLREIRPGMEALKIREDKDEEIAFYP